ncbi:hypothetical protein J4573_48660 [Actinomadura barringtoniae]|uniref:Secreted protein n=1 Tax=Actinomadura barringtoniae TaxID=1427535 RepID=A0A939TA57_9ACTN|nr:hypothetical protein [Actinomadura barringtoniae]MBO2455034.1 hypothetical protein [Actinomadura barringtoniae]
MASIKVVRVFAAAVAGAALVGLAPATHAGAWGEAWFPGQNPSCASNEQIGSGQGAPTSIYDDKGDYWGWAEWRWGTSGSCAGYQWARLHITDGIPLFSDHLTVQLRKTTNGTVTQAFLGGGGGIAAGTYDSTVLYAPHGVSVPIEGTVENTLAKAYVGDNPHPVSSRVFFGHGGIRQQWVA